MKALGRCFVFAVIILSLIISSEGFAGGIKIDKERIIVSPPDEAGMLTVIGVPGTVKGSPPITVVVKNKETDISVPGWVAPNGSFAVKIMGDFGDSLKVNFYDTTGKNESENVKAPKQGKESVKALDIIGGIAWVIGGVLAPPEGAATAPGEEPQSPGPSEQWPSEEPQSSWPSEDTAAGETGWTQGAVTIPDIAGTWEWDFFGKRVYDIKQTNNQFTWEVRPPYIQTAEGSITGNTLTVTWKNKGGKGGLKGGTATGEIRDTDNDGVADEIKMSNGPLFKRIGAASSEPEI